MWHLYLILARQCKFLISFKLFTLSNVNLQSLVQNCWGQIDFQIQNFLGF